MGSHLIIRRGSLGNKTCDALQLDHLRRSLMRKSVIKEWRFRGTIIHHWPWPPSPLEKSDCRPLSGPKNRLFWPDFNLCENSDKFIKSILYGATKQQRMILLYAEPIAINLDNLSWVGRQRWDKYNLSRRSMDRAKILMVIIAVSSLGNKSKIMHEVIQNRKKCFWFFCWSMIVNQRKDRAFFLW